MVLKYCSAATNRAQEAPNNISLLGYVSRIAPTATAAISISRLVFGKGLIPLIFTVVVIFPGSTRQINKSGGYGRLIISRPSLSATISENSSLFLNPDSISLPSKRMITCSLPKSPLASTFASLVNPEVDI